MLIGSLFGRVFVFVCCVRVFFGLFCFVVESFVCCVLCFDCVVCLFVVVFVLVVVVVVVVVCCCRSCVCCCWIGCLCFVCVCGSCDVVFLQTCLQTRAGMKTFPRVPLMCLVDFRGFRLVAVSLYVVLCVLCVCACLLCVCVVCVFVCT